MSLHRACSTARTSLPSTAYFKASNFSGLELLKLTLLASLTSASWLQLRALLSGVGDDLTKSKPHYQCRLCSLGGCTLPHRPMTEETGDISCHNTISLQPDCLPCSNAILLLSLMKVARADLTCFITCCEIAAQTSGRLPSCAELNKRAGCNTHGSGDVSSPEPAMAMAVNATHVCKRPAGREASCSAAGSLYKAAGSGYLFSRLG